MSTLPLSGIVVLDLSRVLAGPLSAQALADLGAQVIKVERPGKGDDSRTFGPPYLTDEAGAQTQENAFYLSANRNKRSVTVDIGSPEGQAIIRDLARVSDIVVENFKVGDLKRYGLDYESLRAVNDGLIYCSITGFGQNGPMAALPGYDAVFQAMVGLMSVTGEPESEGGKPIKAGPSLIDVITGQTAVGAILAALYHRDARGGGGQHIDLALYDCGVAAMSHYAQIYLTSGDIPPRRGTEGNGGVPSRLFECRDGSIMITAGNDMQFQRLCTVLGCEELVDDPRFRTNLARVQHRKELGLLLEPLFQAGGRDHWIAELSRVGVPCGPLNDLAQVFADPQIVARQMQRRIPGPYGAEISIMANPINFSKTPIPGYAAPPLLGEGTDDILGNLLGYDEGRIARLRAAGTI